jgi:hypothetical protein
MRDVLADWRRWSGAERVAAVIAATLFSVVVSTLLVAAVASPPQEPGDGTGIGLISAR